MILKPLLRKSQYRFRQQMASLILTWYRLSRRNPSKNRSTPTSWVTHRQYYPLAKDA